MSARDLEQAAEAIADALEGVTPVDVRSLRIGRDADDHAGGELDGLDLEGGGYETGFLPVKPLSH